MSMMMDIKLDMQVDNLTSRFNELEARMQNDKLERKAALKKAGSERRAEMDAIRADTDRLAEKTSDMENKGISATLVVAPNTPQSTEQWCAGHILVGGWNVDLPNEE